MTCIEGGVFAYKHVVKAGTVGPCPAFAPFKVGSIPGKAESGAVVRASQWGEPLSLRKFDDRIKHVAVGNLMALDHFRQESGQQAFPVTGSDSSRYQNAVVFDPFPEEAVFKIVFVPIPGDFAERQKSAGEVRLHYPVDGFEFPIECPEVVKSPSNYPDCSRRSSRFPKRSRFRDWVPRQWSFRIAAVSGATGRRPERKCIAC